MEKDERVNIAPKRAPARYEVVAGRHRMCRIPQMLLADLLPQARERALCAIEVFADVRDLVAFPMHQHSPAISLRGEQRTKIDGVEIYFYKNRDGVFDIFHVSVDEFDDDGGGQRPLHFIGSLGFDSQSVQGNDIKECGLRGRFGDWGDVAQVFAVEWVVFLTRILFANRMDSFAISRLANSCLTKFHIACGDDQWQADVLLNNLYCWDFRDLSERLVPVILERPNVWSEPDLACPSRRGRRNPICASPKASTRAKQIKHLAAEITFAQAPSGTWMIGLELSCRINVRRLCAYVQLAAPHEARLDSKNGYKFSGFRPAGRLRVRLRRR